MASNRNAIIDLYALGYRVRAGAERFSFLVRTPSKTNVYTVNPTDYTCTCAGFISHGYCKHLSNIQNLIVSQWCGGAAELQEKPSYAQEMYKLRARHIECIDNAKAIHLAACGR